MSDSETVIQVRNLGIRYRLDATLSHATLRDAIAERARRFLSRLRRNGQHPTSHVPLSTFPPNSRRASCVKADLT